MNEMQIRTAEQDDLIPLLELYVQLHDNSVPELNEDLLSIWQQILDDRNHYILIGEENGKVISSCVLIVILNLTREQRPYAVIENVITDTEYRGRGYAARILERAKTIAMKQNCYKIMLMTGSKKESTHRFYERAGYNSVDKTAFIQWLP